MAIEDFDQVTIEASHLRPFSKFIMSIGELPTSYLDSLSYAEQVTWFCDYLQNNVIPAINNNADALEEVQNLMTQLQEYVDNYFTNLDVQEEINNKLDQMAEDGTLTELIGNYVQPLIEAQNLEIDQFEATVTSQVGTLQTQVTGLASGSPLVASSTAGMTDTSRIYVNTTDGKWYYYDGDSWEIGGTYQSSGIDDNSITTAKLKIAKNGKIICGATGLTLTLSENVLTLTNTGSKIIQYEDKFISIPTSTDSKEIDNNTLFYIVSTKINGAYCFKIYNNTEYQAIANRNETLTIAVYYQSYLYPLNNNDNFINIQTGIKILRNEPQFATIVGDGYINIDTTNKRAEITPSGSPSRFYIVCPAMYGYNDVIKTFNQTNVNMIDTNVVQVLYFDTKDTTFKWLDTTISKGINRLIPIAAYYNNVVTAIIEPSHLKVNGTPYYTETLNIHVTGALSQTINQCMEDITNPDNETKIILVGDSITHGQGGTGFAQDGDTIIGDYKRNPNGYCWANLFKSYIENNYNATVTNNGCTGTNIQFLATNINTLIPSDTDIVIISYGTNNRISHDNDVGDRDTDLESMFDTFTDSFNTVITYCLSNNIKFIIQTPPPASATNEALHNRVVHIYDVANIIQNICANKDVEYNNLYNLIYDYCWNNNLDWDDYLADGLHPNDSGYRVMFYKIMQGLNLAPSYIDVDD